MSSKKPKFTPLVLSCDICMAAFFDESKFKEHKRFHEDSISDVNDKKLFLCRHPLCNTLCVDEESYAKHLQVHAYLKPVDLVGCSGAGPNTLVVGEESYAQHQQVHGYVKPLEVKSHSMKPPDFGGYSMKPPEVESRSRAGPETVMGDPVTDGMGGPEQIASTMSKRKREFKVEPGFSEASDFADTSGQSQKKGSVAIGSLIQRKVAHRKRQKLQQPVAAPSPNTVHQVICPHCNVQMFAPMALCMAHIRTHRHHDSGGISKKSKKPFVSMYKNNILSSYSKKKALTFACTDCTETFNSYEKLSKHAKTHVKGSSVARYPGGDGRERSEEASPISQPKSCSHMGSSSQQSTQQNPHGVTHDKPHGSQHGQYQGVGSIIDYSQKAIDAGLIEKTSGTPVVQSPTYAFQIKEEVPSIDPEPLRMEREPSIMDGLPPIRMPSTSPEKQPRSLTDLYKCHEASCTFTSPSSWEYYVHVSNIHPIPTSSSTGNAQRPTSSPTGNVHLPTSLSTGNVHLPTSLPTGNVQLSTSSSTGNDKMLTPLSTGNVQPVVLNIPNVVHRTSTNPRSANEFAAGTFNESCPAATPYPRNSGLQAPTFINLFQCNVCKGHFEDYDSFYKSHLYQKQITSGNRHAQRDSPVALACVHCNKSFPAYYLYMNHMQSHMVKVTHQAPVAVSPESTQVLTTPLPLKKSPHPALPVVHSQRKVKPSSKDSVKKGHIALRCSVCHKRCFTMTDLSNHEKFCRKALKKHQEEEIRNSQPLPNVRCCKPCRAAFETLGLYHEHMTSLKHLNITKDFYTQELKKLNSTLPDNSIPYFAEPQTCTPCSLTFGRIDGYFLHMLSGDHGTVSLKYYTLAAHTEYAMDKRNIHNSKTVKAQLDSIRDAVQDTPELPENQQIDIQSIVEAEPEKGHLQLVSDGDGVSRWRVVKPIGQEMELPKISENETVVGTSLSEAIRPPLPRPENEKVHVIEGRKSASLSNAIQSTSAKTLELSQQKTPSKVVDMLDSIGSFRGFTTAAQQTESDPQSLSWLAEMTAPSMENTGSFNASTTPSSKVSSDTSHSSNRRKSIENSGSSNASTTTLSSKVSSDTSHSSNQRKKSPVKKSYEVDVEPSLISIIPKEPACPLRPFARFYNNIWRMVKSYSDCAITDVGDFAVQKWWELKNSEKADLQKEYEEELITYKEKVKLYKEYLDKHRPQGLHTVNREQLQAMVDNMGQKKLGIQTQPQVPTTGSLKQHVTSTNIQPLVPMVTTSSQQDELRQTTYAHGLTLQQAIEQTQPHVFTTGSLQQHVTLTNSQQLVSMVTTSSQQDEVRQTTSARELTLQQAILASDPVPEDTPANSADKRERLYTASKSMEPLGEAKSLEVQVAPGMNATSIRDQVAAIVESQFAADVSPTTEGHQIDITDCQQVAASAGNKVNAAVNAATEEHQLAASAECQAAPGMNATSEGHQVAASTESQVAPEINQGLQVAASAESQVAPEMNGTTEGLQVAPEVNPATGNITQGQAQKMTTDSMVHEAKISGDNVDQDAERVPTESDSGVPDRSAQRKDPASNQDLKKTNSVDAYNESNSTAKTSSNPTEIESKDEGNEDHQAEITSGADVPSSEMEVDSAKHSITDNVDSERQGDGESKVTAKTPSNPIEIESKDEGIEDQPSGITSVAEVPSTLSDTDMEVDSTKQSPTDNVESENHPITQRNDGNSEEKPHEETSEDATHGLDEEYDDVVPLDEPQTEETAEVIDLTADDVVNQGANPSVFQPQDIDYIKAPDRPATAYKRFYREVYLGVQRENEELNYQDLKKAINNMWRVLPNEERLVYTKQYDEAVQEYNEEFDLYSHALRRRKRQNHPRYNQSQPKGYYPALPRGPDNAVVTSSGQVSGPDNLYSSHAVLPNSAPSPCSLSSTTMAQRASTVMDTVLQNSSPMSSSLSSMLMHKAVPNSTAISSRFSSDVTEKFVQNATPIPSSLASLLRQKVLQNSTPATSYLSSPGTHVTVQNSTPILSTRTGTTHALSGVAAAYESMPKIPDPPLGPYTRFYSSGIIKELRQKHPRVNGWELNKIVGQVWKKMSTTERQPYIQSFELAKIRYDAAVQRFNIHFEQWQKQQKKWRPKSTPVASPAMPSMPRSSIPQAGGTIPPGPHVYQSYVQQQVAAEAAAAAEARSAKERAPKKPLAPYMRFSSSMYRKFKEENPDLNFKELGKLIGQKWRELPTEEQSVYKTAYLMDKRKYDADAHKRKVDFANQIGMTGLQRVTHGNWSQYYTGKGPIVSQSIPQEEVTILPQVTTLQDISVFSPITQPDVTQSIQGIQEMVISVSPENQPEPQDQGSRPSSASPQIIQMIPSSEHTVITSPGVQQVSPQELSFALKLSDGVQQKRPLVPQEVNYGDSTLDEAMKGMQNLFDIVSNPKPNPDLISNGSVKDSLKCEFCGLILHSLESMKTHSSVHTEEHQSTCVECHRHFSNQESLMKHRVTHQTLDSIPASDRKQFLYLPANQHLCSTTMGYLCIYCLKTVRTEDVGHHAKGCGIVVDVPTGKVPTPSSTDAWVSSLADYSVSDGYESKQGLNETDGDDNDDDVDEEDDVGGKDDAGVNDNHGEDDNHGKDDDVDEVSRWEIAPGTSNTLLPVKLIKRVDNHETSSEPETKQDSKVLSRPDYAAMSEGSSALTEELAHETCQYCHQDIYYDKASEFRDHVAKCQAKSSVCPLCKKSYYSNSTAEMKMHLATCAGKDSSTAGILLSSHICRVCSIEFKDMQKLESHIKYYHSLAELIEKNEIRAKDEPDITVNIGIKQLHLDCPLCELSMYFDEEMGMKMHLATCLGPFAKQSWDCSKANPKTIYRHVCEYCNVNLNSKEELKLHVSRHNLKILMKVFQCAECDQKFRFEKGFISHKRVHSKPKKPEESSVKSEASDYICPQISTADDGGGNNVTHVEATIDPVGNRNVNALNDPIGSHNLDITKDLINSHNLDATSDPIGSHNVSAASDSIGSHNLDITNVPVGSHNLDAPSDSIGSHHLDTTIDPIGSHNLDALIMLCPHCQTNIPYTNDEDLNIHMEKCISLNEKRKKKLDNLSPSCSDALIMLCPHCDTNIPYTNDDELKVHLGTCIAMNEQRKMKQNNLSPRYAGACELCDKYFVSREYLVKHILCHSMRKLLACKICVSCYQRFRKEGELLAHRSTVHGFQLLEKPEDILDVNVSQLTQASSSPKAAHHVSCSHCDMEIYYNQENELRIHLATCMSKNPELLIEKKLKESSHEVYFCQVCLSQNKTAGFSYNELRHHVQLMHSMSILLLGKSCKLCGSRFRTKEQLAKHARKWEGKCYEPMKKIMSTISDEMLKQDGVISGTPLANEKKANSMKCPHCNLDITYRLIEDLQYHLATCIRGLHLGKPNEVCQVCGDYHNEKEAMWNHAKSHMLRDLMSKRVWTLTLENRHLFVAAKPPDYASPDVDEIDQDDEQVSPLTMKRSRAEEEEMTSSKANTSKRKRGIDLPPPSDCKHCNVALLCMGRNVDHPHQCRFCQVIMGSSIKLRKHEREHATVHICLECTVCRTRYANQERLGIHMLSHIKSYIQDGEELICTVCDYRERMSRLVSFVNHVVMHQWEGQSSSSQSEIPSIVAAPKDLEMSQRAGFVDLSVVKIEKVDSDDEPSTSTEGRKNSSSANVTHAKKVSLLGSLNLQVALSRDRERSVELESEDYSTDSSSKGDKDSGTPSGRLETTQLKNQRKVVQSRIDEIVEESMRRKVSDDCGRRTERLSNNNLSKVVSEGNEGDDEKGQMMTRGGLRVVSPYNDVVDMETESHDIEDRRRKIEKEGEKSVTCESGVYYKSSNQEDKTLEEENANGKKDPPQTNMLQKDNKYGRAEDAEMEFEGSRGVDAKIGKDLEKLFAEETKTSGAVADNNAYLMCPSKPLSSYMRFSCSMYKKFKEENPELNFRDLACLIGKKWRALPKEEQNVYKTAYFNDQQKYDHDMSKWRAYKNAMKTESHDVEDKMKSEKEGEEYVAHDSGMTDEDLRKTEDAWMDEIDTSIETRTQDMPQTNSSQEDNKIDRIKLVMTESEGKREVDAKMGKENVASVSKSSSLVSGTDKRHTDSSQMGGTVAKGTDDIPLDLETLFAEDIKTCGAVPDNNTYSIRPSKPLSPYIRFHSSMYKKFKEENPDLGFSDLAVLIGRKWRELSKEEQNVYRTALPQEGQSVYGTANVVDKKKYEDNFYIKKVDFAPAISFDDIITTIQPGEKTTEDENETRPSDKKLDECNVSTNPNSATTPNIIPSKPSPPASSACHPQSMNHDMCRTSDASYDVDACSIAFDTNKKQEVPVTMSQVCVPGDINDSDDDTMEDGMEGRSNINMKLIEHDYCKMAEEKQPLASRLEPVHHKIENADKVFVKELNSPHLIKIISTPSTEGGGEGSADGDKVLNVVVPPAAGGKVIQVVVPPANASKVLKVVVPPADESCVSVFRTCDEIPKVAGILVKGKNIDDATDHSGVDEDHTYSMFVKGTSSQTKGKGIGCIKKVTEERGKIEREKRKEDSFDLDCAKTDVSQRNGRSQQITLDGSKKSSKNEQLGIDEGSFDLEVANGGVVTQSKLENLQKIEEKTDKVENMRMEECSLDLEDARVGFVIANKFNNLQKNKEMTNENEEIRMEEGYLNKEDENTQSKNQSQQSKTDGYVNVEEDNSDLIHDSSTEKSFVDLKDRKADGVTSSSGKSQLDNLEKCEVPMDSVQESKMDRASTDLQNNTEDGITPVDVKGMIRRKIVVKIEANISEGNSASEKNNNTQGRSEGHSKLQFEDLLIFDANIAKDKEKSQNVGITNVAQKISVCSSCCTTYKATDGHKCLAQPIQIGTHQYRCPYCTDRVYTRRYNCSMHITKHSKDPQLQNLPDDDPKRRNESQATKVKVLSDTCMPIMSDVRSLSASSTSRSSSIERDDILEPSASVICNDPARIMDDKNGSSAGPPDSFIKVYDAVPICLFCCVRHDIAEECRKTQKKGPKCPFCEKMHGVDQRCDSMVDYLKNYKPASDCITPPATGSVLPKVVQSVPLATVSPATVGPAAYTTYQAVHPPANQTLLQRQFMRHVHEPLKVIRPVSSIALDPNIPLGLGRPASDGLDVASTPPKTIREMLDIKGAGMDGKYPVLRHGSTPPALKMIRDVTSQGQVGVDKTNQMYAAGYSRGSTPNASRMLMRDEQSAGMEVDAEVYVVEDEVEIVDGSAIASNVHISGSAGASNLHSGSTDASNVHVSGLASASDMQIRGSAGASNMQRGLTKASNVHVSGSASASDMQIRGSVGASNMQSELAGASDVQGTPGASDIHISDFPGPSNMQRHYKDINKSTTIDELAGRVEGVTEGSKWDSSLVYDDSKNKADLGDIRCPFCYEDHSRPHVCLQTMVYLATFGKYEPLKLGDGVRARFMCPVCYDDFPWDYNCRAHTFAKHVKNLKNSDVSISVKSGPVPVKISANRYACPCCKVPFISHQACRSHLKTCRSKGKEKTKDPSLVPFKSNKPRYRCPFCPEVHTRPYNCRYHVMKQHTRCQQPDEPSEPVKLEHERYLCPFCSNEFSRESSCKKHITLIHRDTDRLICGHCQMTYEAYENHRCLRLPVREKAGTYRCPYCPDKVFTRGYNCTAHIKEKHSNPGKEARRPHAIPPTASSKTTSPSKATQQQVDPDFSRIVLANQVASRKKIQYKNCFSCGNNYHGEHHKCMFSKCPHCKLVFQLRSELMKHILANHKLAVPSGDQVQTQEEAVSDPRRETQELMAAADYYDQIDFDEVATEVALKSSQVSVKRYDVPNKPKGDLSHTSEDQFHTLQDPHNTLEVSFKSSEDPSQDGQMLPVIESVYSQSDSGSRDDVSSYMGGSIDDDVETNDDIRSQEDEFVQEDRDSMSPDLIQMPSDDDDDNDSDLMEEEEVPKHTMYMKDIVQMTEDIKGHEPVITKLKNELGELAGVYKELEEREDLPTLEPQLLKQQIANVVSEAVMTAKELLMMYKVQRPGKMNGSRSNGISLQRQNGAVEIPASQAGNNAGVAIPIALQKEEDDPLIPYRDMLDSVQAAIPSNEINTSVVLGDQSYQNQAGDQPSSQRGVDPGTVAFVLGVHSQMESVPTEKTGTKRKRSDIESLGCVPEDDSNTSPEKIIRVTSGLTARYGIKAFESEPSTSSGNMDSHPSEPLHGGFQDAHPLVLLRGGFQDKGDIDPPSPLKRQYGKTSSLDFKGVVMVMAIDDEYACNKVKVDKPEGLLKAKVWCPYPVPDGTIINSPVEKKYRKRKIISPDKHATSPTTVQSNQPTSNPSQSTSSHSQPTGNPLSGLAALLSAKDGNPDEQTTDTQAGNPNQPAFSPSQPRPLQPVQPTGNPSQPTDDQSQLTDNSNKITGNSSQTAGKISQLTGDQSQLSGNSGQITGNPSQPTDDQSQLTGNSCQTAIKPSPLTGKQSQPTGNSSQPTGNSSQTACEPIHPTDSPSETMTNPCQTVTSPPSTAKPSQTINNSSQTADEPRKSTSSPSETTSSLCQTGDKPSQTVGNSSQTDYKPSQLTGSQSETFSSSCQTFDKPSPQTDKPSQATDNSSQTVVKPSHPVDSSSDTIGNSCQTADKPSQLTGSSCQTGDKPSPQTSKPIQPTENLSQATSNSSQAASEPSQKAGKSSSQSDNPSQPSDSTTRSSTDDPSSEDKPPRMDSLHALLTSKITNPYMQMVKSKSDSTDDEVVILSERDDKDKHAKSSETEADDKDKHAKSSESDGWEEPGSSVQMRAHLLIQTMKIDQIVKSVSDDAE